MSKPVRVAAAQFELRPHQDLLDYREHVLWFFEMAQKVDADLLAFPEDVGLPLAVLDDYDVMSQALSLEEAASAIFERHAGELTPLVTEQGLPPVQALLVSRAEDIRRAYEETFGYFAREYGIYVAAGSAPLTDPKRRRDVYNESILFDRRGKTVLRQRKVDLIDLETDGLNLSPGEPGDYNVARTELGILGIGVCADCFNRDLVDCMVEQGMELLIDPKANPKEFTPEEEEENRTSSWARCQESPIFALQVFAVGNILDIPFRGRSAVYGPAKLTPDGSGVVAIAESDDSEELVTAAIDLELLGRVRVQAPEKG